MALRRLLLVVLLLTAVAARAQVCSSEAPLRRVLPVNVLDKEGNLVRGLTAADFRGKFRRQPVKILSVTRTTGSRRIVILLDASGSMTESPKWQEMGPWGAADAVAFAPVGSSLALIVFAKEVVARVDLTPERQAITNKLTHFGPDYRPPEGAGSTALVDALMRGMELLNPPHLGDVIYAVTDGVDNKSGARWRDMQRELVAGGIRLYGLLLLERGSQRYQPWERLGPGNFKETVALTGGTWIVVEGYELGEKQRQALVGAARRLYERMGDFYSLELELARPAEKPRDWKLEVVDANGKRRKDLEVVYPQKLVPCAPPPTP